MELAAWHIWWNRQGASGVRRLLMNRWDPIGVAGVPEAADEYDSYVGVLGERLRSGTSADQIASYLTWVQVDRMGLAAADAAAAHDRVVAAELRRWYEQDTSAAS